MTSRDRHQLAQDRADLYAVLREATGPLRTDTAIARANGMHDPALTDRAWRRHYAHGIADLRALAAAGRIVEVRDPGSNWPRWRPATDADVDAASDRAEVDRLEATWENA